MKNSDVFAKTAKGQQELQTRSLRLAPRLRSLLIMIDGSITVGELQRAAATFGAPDDWIETLAKHDLIYLASSMSSEESTPPAAAQDTVPQDFSQTDRFRSVQKFMNDTVVEALGLRAFFFTLKLERCYNLADLQALIPEYGKALGKGSNEVTARALESRVREMLR